MESLFICYEAGDCHVAQYVPTESYQHSLFVVLPCSFTLDGVCSSGMVKIISAVVSYQPVGMLISQVQSY